MHACVCLFFSVCVCVCVCVSVCVFMCICVLVMMHMEAIYNVCIFLFNRKADRLLEIVSDDKTRLRKHKLAYGKDVV